jgi:Ca-activated chloride channel family protein
VGPAEPDERDDGDYLVLRVEAPPAKEQDGVTLALVLDVSGSMAPALLDASRALVEALLTGLGPQDRVAVFAADQELSPVGPSEMGPLDESRRAAILAALNRLSSGGATDLGRALERAADAIPVDAPAGMVVYIGDGWPTVGDLDVDRIEARLARRAGGIPRIGAVAVGPLANRFSLGALVRDSGPLLEIDDRSDAASTAIALMADALRPAVADVRVVFPPGVDRIYPRGGHAAIAGSTVTAVARVKGEMPRNVELVWRAPDGEKRETLAVEPRTATDAREVRRRLSKSEGFLAQILPRFLDTVFGVQARST